MSGDLIKWYEEEVAELEAASGCPEPLTKQIGSAFDLELLARKMVARDDMLSKCESPIEVALGTCIVAGIGHVFEANGLELWPQYRWRGFRMDFAIRRGNTPVMFIECDGKEFHSTPAQIANDRRKDDAAERAEIPILRFTGSEIFRSPDGCVHRVLEYLVRRSVV